MKFIVIVMVSLLALLMLMVAIWEGFPFVVGGGGTPDDGGADDAPTLPWPLGPGDVAYPIGNAFGQYQDYGWGADYHDGIDVMVAAGKELFAMEAGTVGFVVGGEDDPVNYGVVVMSDDDPDFGYLYMHFDPTDGAHVVGKPIVAGEKLGLTVEWSDPTDYDHIHVSAVEKDPAAPAASPFPFLYVANPLPRLKDAADAVDPEVLDVRFYKNGSTSQFLPDPGTGKLEVDGEVDVVVQVQDRFLDPAHRLLIPYRVRVQAYKSGTEDLAYENEIAFEGDLGEDRSAYVESVYRAGDCKGDYGDREFHVVATNEPHDESAAWDTAADGGAGEYEIRVTVEDAYGRSAEAKRLVTVP